MDWSMTWWIDDYNITIDFNYEGIKMHTVGNMEIFYNVSSMGP